MPYPVHLDIEYPERLSRGILILRTLFSPLYVGIPHGICLAVYGIVVFFIMVIAWVAVLFTGVYPRDLFEITTKYYRWYMRVHAYLSFMTDQYPPFNGDE
jgi:hypothetical protein